MPKSVKFYDPDVRKIVIEMISSGKIEIASIMSPFTGSAKANMISFLHNYSFTGPTHSISTLLGWLAGWVFDFSKGLELQPPSQLLAPNGLIYGDLSDWETMKIFPEESDQSDTNNTASKMKILFDSVKTENKYCFYSNDDKNTVSQIIVSKPREQWNEDNLSTVILTEPGDGTVTEKSQKPDYFNPQNTIKINGTHREGFNKIPEVLTKIPSLEGAMNGYQENFRMYDELRKTKSL